MSLTEDVQNVISNYKNISGNATTTVKSGTGILVRIVCNWVSGAIIAIYDNTAGSGTLIGEIESETETPISLEYGCQFNTGLTIVTSNNSSTNITVIYQ